MTGVQLKFAFDECKIEEGSAGQPRLSEGLVRPLCRRAVGGRRAATRRRARRRWSFEGSVGGRSRSSISPPPSSKRATTNSCAFVERLWAVRRVGEILDELDLNGRNEELVDGAGRAVQAARHPHALHLVHGRRQRRPARRWPGTSARPAAACGTSDDTSGVSGVEQRAYKGAARASGAGAGQSQKQSLDAFAKNATGGGMGGAGYGAQASISDAFGRQVQQEAAAAEKNVRNVGNRAFFRSNGQWIDSRLTREQQSNAKRIKQFSREYFELAAHAGRTMSQYMAFDEPAMVSLDGQAYLIEP